MQALEQSPGFQTLLFYDFQGAETADDVAYTRRWPRLVREGDVACCYPGVSWHPLFGAPCCQLMPAPYRQGPRAGMPYLLRAAACELV